jgi:hypothetical protein
MGFEHRAVAKLDPGFAFSCKRLIWGDDQAITPEEATGQGTMRLHLDDLRRGGGDQIRECG